MFGMCFGQLVDLPCIIESMKTTDCKNFFKTADICQVSDNVPLMLIIRLNRRISLNFSIWLCICLYVPSCIEDSSYVMGFFRLIRNCILTMGCIVKCRCWYILVKCTNSIIYYYVLCIIKCSRDASAFCAI